MFLNGTLDGLNGPPTPFALKVRPWLVCSLVLLTVVAGARLTAQDVTGAFFLALTVLMGYMAIRKGMNIAWLLCLAMVLFLNSLLDAFLLIAVGMKSHWVMFSRQQSGLVLTARVLIAAGPIVEILAASMCWLVYKDHVQSSGSDAFLLHSHQEYPEVANYRSTGASQQQPKPREQGFSAFSGTGHRLVA
eukprot:TRINITY_DN19096_c0_g1_i1.p1 TRINITY_DN19096_c0_g1~~TRINITY_DN19096_c0_g1_i1.p1  ORF type:complete len:190 (+),score=30.78 TRINITY_DN19096_c0_g1_i1:102-671(+)